MLCRFGVTVHVAVDVVVVGYQTGTKVDSKSLLDILHGSQGSAVRFLETTKALDVAIRVGWIVKAHSDDAKAELGLLGILAKFAGSFFGCCVGFLSSLSSINITSEHGEGQRDEL